MAEEADPLGQRTLGVLAKPDLIDRGGEEHVMDLVCGTKNKLNLGYCMVWNRGQQDKSLSYLDMDDVQSVLRNSRSPRHIAQFRSLLYDLAPPPRLGA